MNVNLIAGGTAIFGGIEAYLPPANSRIICLPPRS